MMKVFRSICLLVAVSLCLLASGCSLIKHEHEMIKDSHAGSIVAGAGFSIC